MCARTCGNPYFLFLTTIGGLTHCIFIDEKIRRGHKQPRMILTKFWFDKMYFTGTVLEGEMVRTAQNKWMFLINDLLVDRRQVLHNVNLVKRINMVYKMLGESFLPDAVDHPCTIQVKKYFVYEQFSEMREVFIPSLSCAVTGIIFKSLHLKFKDILYDMTVANKRVRSNNTKNGKRCANDEDSNEGEDCNQQEDYTCHEKDCNEKDYNDEEYNSFEDYNNTASSGSDDPVKTQGVYRLTRLRRTKLPDVYEIVTGHGSHNSDQNDSHEVACIWWSMMY